MNDPKGHAALILAHMKPSSGDGGGDEGLHAAAEELISAIHSKNAAGVAEAFRNLSDICDDDDYGGES